MRLMMLGIVLPVAHETQLLMVETAEGALKSSVPTRAPKYRLASLMNFFCSLNPARAQSALAIASLAFGSATASWFKSPAAWLWTLFTAMPLRPRTFAMSRFVVDLAPVKATSSASAALTGETRTLPFGLLSSRLTKRRIPKPLLAAARAAGLDPDCGTDGPHPASNRSPAGAALTRADAVRLAAVSRTRTKNAARYFMHNILPTCSNVEIVYNVTVDPARKSGAST